MAHQDQGRDTSKLTNQQALKSVLEWLLAGISWTGVRFRDDCSWSPKLLVATCLFWVWGDAKTLQGRFTTARKIALRIYAGPMAVATSYQAFTKVLQRWTAALEARVQQRLREAMRERLAERFQLAGFIPFGGDGSKFGLARTASLEQAFAPVKSRQRADRQKARRRAARPARPRRLCQRQRAAAARAKKATSPQLAVTVLWHLCCGLPWSWRLGPSNRSERAHLQQMLVELPTGALVVADAGFYGYALWQGLLAADQAFIMRVGSNVRLLRRLGYVRERGDVVYCWPDREAAKGQPPLVLRLVVIHDGRQPVYLVTSVLDHRRLSNRQVSEFYRLRWGVEVYYRHVKQTYELRKLRSRAATNAPLEATWALLGLWAMAIYAYCHLQAQDIPPARVSMAQVLRAFRQPMREYKSRPDPGEDVHALLDLAVIDAYCRRSKASRDYPCKKREPGAGPPHLRVATRKQKKKALEIRDEMQKGLTA
jgi:hypothetical protein